MLSGWVVEEVSKTAKCAPNRACGDVLGFVEVVPLLGYWGGFNNGRPCSSSRLTWRIQRWSTSFLGQGCGEGWALVVDFNPKPIMMSFSDGQPRSCVEFTRRSQ